MEQPDKYQARYLEHQMRKGESLKATAPPHRRRSVRVFDVNHDIDPGDVERIVDAVRFAPSSCNRQAVYVKVLTALGSLRNLEHWLVGGRNWICGANAVFLFFADQAAYKAPGEIAYMPYLDGAAACMAAIQGATEMGIGSCFVCPNVRIEDLPAFTDEFNPHGWTFTCALALGYPAGPVVAPPKRTHQEVYYP